MLANFSKIVTNNKFGEIFVIFWLNFSWGTIFLPIFDGLHGF
jgi:hypothetical protein